MLAKGTLKLYTCCYLGDLVECNHGVFPYCNEFCLRDGGGANGGVKAGHVACLTKMVE